MNTLLKSAALSGLALAALSGGAWAQSTGHDNRANSMAIKLGFYAPSKSTARTAGGDSLFSIEGDYVIQSVPERNETSVLSLGYIERDDLRILPLTLSQITHDHKRTSAYDFYYGYGIGLYSIRLNTPETSGNTKVMPGAAFTFGLNLSSSTFIEAKYHYISHYEKQDVRGFQLFLGARM